MINQKYKIWKIMLITGSVFSFLFFSIDIHANAGVFYGSGNQIIPIRNSDIQLKNEKVYFTFKVPAHSAKLGVPFIPVVNIKANFELFNKTDKTLTPQIGFPFLDLQGFGDEKEALRKIQFKVNSDGKKQKTVLKKGLIEKKLDPEGLFKKVFSWDETFKPNQTKILDISYVLDMSVSVHPQAVANDDDFFRITYFFSYITKTAYTWSSPLETAVFEADFSAIMKMLKSKKIIKDFLPDKGPSISKPFITLTCAPTATRKDHLLIWAFKEKMPVEGLSISLNILNIPIKLKELEEMVLEEENKKDKESYIDFIEALINEYKTQGPFLLFEEDAKELPAIQQYLEKVLGFLESSLV